MYSRPNLNERRKRTEQELREAHETLRAIVESAMDAIISVDERQQILVFNSAAEQMFGCTAEEAIGTPLDRFIPPQYRTAHSQHVNNFGTTGTTSRSMRSPGTLTALRANGREFPIEATISQVQLPAGKLYTVILRDITERKAVEEKLRASEAKFRAAFEYAAVGMGRVRFSDGTWIDANDALCDMVGYTAEEMRVTPWMRITHPDDIDVDYVPFRRMAAGELNSYTIEKRFIHKRGAIVWARLTVSLVRDADGKPDYEVAVVEDISESKAAEKELQESQEELQFALQAANAGSWSLDIVANRFTLGPESQKLLFMSAHPTLEEAFERIHPEYHGLIAMELDACAKGQRDYSVEFRVQSPEGQERWVEARGRRIEKHGKAWVYEINHDVTERKRAGRAVRESEQRFRTLAENIPQMIWVADDRTNFHYLSPKWLEYTGTTLEQNNEGHWADALHPDDRENTRRAWQEATDNGSTYQIQYRLRRHDGEYRWHLVRAVPMHDPETKGTLWFGTTTDIQDQMRAQEALIRSEKLASVGRMAATVAHEINNPLELVMNLVYLATLDENLQPRTREALNTAEQELERVAHLTRQTLGFYRENTAPSDLEVTSLVKDVVQMYNPKLLQRDIKIDFKAEEKLSVHGVAGEIRQVVSNVISNAIDASSKGGKLVVRTSSVPLKGKQAVRITLADTGEGIRPENLQRIFEPFFTTKESVGTGLGLWVSSEIVQRHRGRIRVRSRRGEGTVFSIFLPAA